MQRLECLADKVQSALRASRDYWLEMVEVLTEQRESRPARIRVVRSSQCLHRRRRRLTQKAWQPRAYDPDTRPACAGLVRGVVSRDRRALFSDIDTPAADEDAECSPSRSAAVVRTTRRSCSSSSRKGASQEAARQDVQAAHARARRHSDEDPRGGWGPRCRRCPARTSITMPAECLVQAKPIVRVLLETLRRPALWVGQKNNPHG